MQVVRPCCNLDDVQVVLQGVRPLTGRYRTERTLGLAPVELITPVFVPGRSDKKGKLLGSTESRARGGAASRAAVVELEELVDREAKEAELDPQRSRSVPGSDQ